MALGRLVGLWSVLTWALGCAPRADGKSTLLLGPSFNISSHEGSLLPTRRASPHDVVRAGLPHGSRTISVLDGRPPRDTSPPGESRGTQGRRGHFWKSPLVVLCRAAFRATSRAVQKSGREPQLRRLLPRTMCAGGVCCSSERSERGWATVDFVRQLLHGYATDQKRRGTRVQLGPS